jgi:mannosyl-oligosaccharide glucosidase
MMRDTRHSSLLTGLLCLFATQLPLANAQVADIEKATNASLLWGPYRPNLYFGVRPRIPKSLMGGLLWTRVEDYTSVQNSECIHTKMRHPRRRTTDL